MTRELHIGHCPAFPNTSLVAFFRGWMIYRLYGGVGSWSQTFIFTSLSAEEAGQ